MSVKTWKKEFYPVNAQSLRVNPRKPNWLKAAKHSLQKWIGLKKSNLKRHNITLYDLEDEFEISCKTCALCYLASFTERDDECETCPMVTMAFDLCDADGSSWDEWSHNESVQPMINSLKKIVKELEKN